MSARYVCIHGHFYQPPRENPWLESVEIQDSAHPFHDWNARITHECYAANAAARVLDEDGKIQAIVNNYARMSFNMGPTLLSWMQTQRPRIYEAILRADRQSVSRFGHGSAMAQAYNHIIMPLANERDKRTQIVWGIADFEARYKRRPQGMWLAETAVDAQTLELMAQHGIEFTVLAPHQAARVRHQSCEEWTEVGDQGVDTRRAYVQSFESGQQITLFFYDGPTSRAVAFERLLERGERFAQRLTAGLDEAPSEPQLAHIATDGETYGHHHTYGEMALAYALEVLDQGDDVDLSIYPKFMRDHPAQWDVEIAPNTSWSCAHGVERWRSDCGCTNGETQGANQSWRGPLRRALDRLRDAAAQAFEAALEGLVDDPWGARDAYIHVLLDRAHAPSFLARHAPKAASQRAQARVLCAMEMQRNAMLMYTSCGWFFDEVSRIETVQLMRYAARVIQLAQPHTDVPLHTRLLEDLSQAPSFSGVYEHAAQVYEDQIKPLDLKRICAHHAIVSLLEVPARTYCYDVEEVEQQRLRSGRMQMAFGRVCITSTLTQQHQWFDYAVLDMGDHNITGGTSLIHGADASRPLDAMARAREAFERGEYLSLMRLIGDVFEDDVFTLRSLFKDEQRIAIEHRTDVARQDAVEMYANIYDQREGLMRFLADLGNPLPPVFQAAAQITLNARLTQVLSTQPLSQEQLHGLLREARRIGAALDWEGARFRVAQLLEVDVQAWSEDPWELDLLLGLIARVETTAHIPLNVDVWAAQNAFERVRRMLPTAAQADARWREAFGRLGQMLHMSPVILDALGVN